MDREILIKSFVCELNELEKRELEEWLEHSKAHRRYYERLGVLAKQQKKLPVDVERNYQEFLERVRQRQAQRRIVRLRKWCGVAAAVACIFGVAIGLMFRAGGGEEPVVDVPLLVATEGTDAVLKIEGEKAFLINEDTDEQLLQRSGTALGDVKNTMNYVKIWKKWRKITVLK